MALIQCKCLQITIAKISEIYHMYKCVSSTINSLEI